MTSIGPDNGYEVDTRVSHSGRDWAPCSTDARGKSRSLLFYLKYYILNPKAP